MRRLYYEDYEEGSVDIFGSRTLTREEIAAFAAEYDPQPMHLDEEAARHSFLGGLSASGWHITSLMMRMMFDGFVGQSFSMGSPGVEEVKWLKPVRPGDRLTLRRTVLDKRVSNSRPVIGLVRIRCELLNEAGEPVIEQISTLLIERRSAEPSQ